MRSSGNPGIRFRSEVPDNAAARENIVLAALARIYIELRHTQRVGYMFVRRGLSRANLV